MKPWFASLPTVACAIVAALVMAIITGPVPAAADTGAPFHLDVADDELISVEVRDGSVVELVEELGRRLDFEVIAHGVDDARVTLNLDGLTPRQALRAICKPVGYVEVSDPATGRIARLVLSPGKGGSTNRMAARREPFVPRPEPPVESPPPEVEPVARPDAPPDEQPDEGAEPEPPGR